MTSSARTQTQVHDPMTRAIRKHFKDFFAVAVLVVIAFAITSFILTQQRLSLPDWVPVAGTKVYTLNAQFSTGQALTPGQGQTVNIAGVPIGAITEVNLNQGRAIVTMEIDPKYEGRIHPDATMLLRPKTGLKDMVIALDPGTEASGPAIPDGGTLPISRTLPDVNLDEFLSVLDADTRDYLTLLLNGGGEGLVGNGRTLAQVLRRFDPTQRNIALITSELQKRQSNLKRVTSDLQLLLNELGSKDTQLAAFVDNSSRVLGIFAAQDANIRKTVALLPGALGATNTAVQAAGNAFAIAGPTLGGLEPAAKALAPAQVASAKFFTATKGPIRTQLRPFSIDTLPVLKNVTPTVANLSTATPNLTTGMKSLNYGLNELAYNPPGDVPPYLFNLLWTGHNQNALLGNQDANGPVRNGTFLASKDSYEVTYNVVHTIDCLNNPFLKLQVNMLRAPSFPYTDAPC